MRERAGKNYRNLPDQGYPRHGVCGDLFFYHCSYLLFNHIAFKISTQVSILKSKSPSHLLLQKHTSSPPNVTIVINL